VNLAGALGRSKFPVKILGIFPGQNLKFPIVFKSTGKNKKKEIKETREFLLKIRFRQNRFWFLV